MNGETPDIKQISTVFPYLMIVFSCFLIGFIFMSINVPLLIDELNGTKYDSFHDVVSSLILQKCDNLSTISLIQYGFSILALGFALNPVSQIIAFLLRLMLISDSNSPKFRKFESVLTSFLGSPENFFTPEKYKGEKYAQFSIWLLKHKPEKLIWEWALFNYNLYWGLSTNALVFFRPHFVSIEIFESLVDLIDHFAFAFDTYKLLQKRNYGSVT